MNNAKKRKYLRQSDFPLLFHYASSWTEWKTDFSGAFRNGNVHILILINRAILLLEHLNFWYMPVFVSQLEVYCKSVALLTGLAAYLNFTISQWDSNETHLAPFNDHVDTFWHPVPKMAEIFFGDFLGSTMTKKPPEIFFFTFGGALGPLFQKNLKSPFFKFWNFRINFLSPRWSYWAEIFFGRLWHDDEAFVVYH